MSDVAQCDIQMSTLAATAIFTTAQHPSSGGVTSVVQCANENIFVKFKCQNQHFYCLVVKMNIGPKSRGPLAVLVLFFLEAGE